MSLRCLSGAVTMSEAKSDERKVFQSSSEVSVRLYIRSDTAAGRLSAYLLVPRNLVPNLQDLQYNTSQ